MGNNPSNNQDGSDLPVENVTWYNAIQYCNELSKSEGLTPCYTISGNTVTWDKSANGYRLPTEAEWEYAARANTESPFSFGDYVHDEDANCYNAYGYNNDATGHWVNGYLGHTVAVDSYAPNAYGLYNMHGNVGEWVWDWYSDYTSSNEANPTGSESGAYKVARGGGWNDMPKHIRSSYRIAFPADVPLYSIGFRVVRNADNASTGIVTSTLSTEPSESTGKVLIAYFSQTGNTKGFAEIIKEMTDADIFRIERKTPYSAASNSQTLYAEALNEQRENAVPELKAYLEDVGLDINKYDTILLGYSNWWASVPAPVVSFLSRYDMSGKTIIPFCSMGGGRFGQSISTVAKLTPNSTIKEGLCVTYSSYDRAEISKWLAKGGINIINQ
ncbi:MAG: flavodoxin [Monoglobaceae bacterium]